MASVRDAVDLFESGQWEAAHDVVQNLQGREAAFLHGVLHRYEGDYSNTRYWFHMAADLPRVLGVDSEGITRLAEQGQEVTVQVASELDALKRHLEAE